MEYEIKTEINEKYTKVKQQEFIINDIVVKMDKNEEVSQIRFKLKDFVNDLTYKPTFKEVKTDKVRGLKVEQTETKLFLIDDLNDKIFDINDRIKDSGKVVIVTDYTIMRDYNKEGEQVEYWFINNQDFETMIIKE